ncbi:MAG: DUF3108 domain-containing protein, partial [Flavitalea sp.]
MNLFKPLSIFLFTILSFPLVAQNGFCELRNTAFQVGESITFKVFYSLSAANIGAGEATFTTTLETLNRKPVYHIIGEGKTYPFYD